MAKHHMSNERYLAALIRIRSQIFAGLKLEFWDDTTIGDKDTYCSWGLCSLNTHKRQTCPFDMRTRPIKNSCGCFHTCRIFQRKQEPTQDEALALFDEEIRRVEALIQVKDGAP